MLCLLCVCVCGWLHKCGEHAGSVSCLVGVCEHMRVCAAKCCVAVCWRGNMNGKRADSQLGFVSLQIAPSYKLPIMALLTMLPLLHRLATLHLVTLKYWNLDRAGHSLLTSGTNFTGMVIKRKKRIVLRCSFRTDPSPVRRRAPSRSDWAVAAWRWKPHAQEVAGLNPTVWRGNWI